MTIKELIVQQGPVIFSISVKDNILLGKPQAHKEDVIHSSIVANVHNFIIQLKVGHKTMINKNSLSRGQKQRIYIARVIMMNTPVILLDETTAALYIESEKLVQESFPKIKEEKNSASIVVAHRFETVKSASRIFVMDKGKIIEEGAHEELLQRSEAYSKLLENQLL